MEVSSVEFAPVEGVKHDFLELSSTRLHVAEAGQGVPVLMLHGFPQNWWQFREAIGSLSDKFRPICPDMPGFGASTPLPGRYSTQNLLEVVIELLDALGLEKVHLIAHDWGALLGFQLALRHPERLLSFISLAIPPPYFKPSPQLLGKVVVHGWFEMVLPWPVLTPYLLGRGRQALARYLLTASSSRPDLWKQEDLENYLAPLRGRDQGRAAAALYRNFILPEGFRAMTGHYRRRPLTVRTLVLMGSDDSVMDPKLLRWDTALTPHLELREVPSAGHFLLEEQPTVVLGHIERFLSEQ